MERGHEDMIDAEAPQGRRLLVSVLLVILLAALVLLLLLGHRPLTDWDEGIYAEIAREMLATHTLQGWLIPHWNGHLWFEKPPLQMWLTAASLRLFGLNAFAARFPSALAGIAIVAVLHGWLHRRVSLLAAWLSTVILLSAFGFQHAARVGETDTLLSLYCLVAVLGLAELLQGKAEGWILFWTGFALALMTKGAASITLPLTALALATLHPRCLLRHLGACTLGLLIFFGLTVPWHAYVYAHFGQAFLHDYIGFHTLTRATNAIEGHHTHPWFYVWILLVSAPLFSLLYPWAVAAPFRRQTSPMLGNSFPNENSLQALALYVLITFLLFTAAQTRLPHYIAPCYPALSALTGCLIARWYRARSTASRRTTARLAPLALTLYVAATLLTAAPRKALHNPTMRNGYTTPDNRGSVALLQQLQRTETPLPPGPLLVWRQYAVVPLTTDAFYARRLAEQVSLTPPPAGLPLDPYFNNPYPLTQAVSTPRLLLFDTSLAAQLPAGFLLQPIAQESGQALAILSRNAPTEGTTPSHSPSILTATRASDKLM